MEKVETDMETVVLCGCVESAHWIGRRFAWDVLKTVDLRWTPHPVIVTIQDN